MKEFEEVCLYVAEVMKFVVKMVKKKYIIDKGWNAGKQYFSPFPTSFQKWLSLGSALPDSNAPWGKKGLESI